MWRFTPSHVVKDLHNPFYRGCWHEFSLCFIFCYFHNNHKKSGFTTSNTVITHGDLLGRTWIHCPRFFTAAINVQALFKARCGRSLVKAC
jgi:hypothetical protein